ncbi:hypothetical protein KC19_7G128100 [Ceratodon purpureus]|uniref:Uncharacterized protein n=1 Tax=Ceratodon purpureus TaxID=3225 RepID=A0A8T0HAZ7_CERPU|nr:hypothetical protein KC19_7G128100 [Ceratodon purpureus]
MPSLGIRRLNIHFQAALIIQLDNFSLLRIVVARQRFRSSELSYEKNCAISISDHDNNVLCSEILSDINCNPKKPSHVLWEYQLRSRYPRRCLPEHLRRICIVEL